MPGSLHSDSSDSDLAIYSDADRSIHQRNSNSAEIHRSADDIEARTPRARRLSNASNSGAGLENPFTKGEKTFMAASAALVAFLTVAAVFAVLSKAEL